MNHYAGQLPTEDVGAHRVAFCPSSVGSKGPVAKQSEIRPISTWVSHFMFHQTNILESWIFESWENWIIISFRTKEVLGIFPSIQVLKLLVVDFQKWCGYPQLFILLQVNIQGTHIYQDQKSDTSEIWGLCADQSITVCCLMLTPVCSSRPAEITAQTWYLLYLEFVLCSKGSLVPTGHTTHTHLHIWPPVGKKCTIKSKCSFFGFFKYSNDFLTSLCLCNKHTAWCSPASCVNKFWHLSSFLMGFHVRVTVCNLSCWAHGNLGMRPGSRSCLVWQKSGWNELMLAESMRVLTFRDLGTFRTSLKNTRRFKKYVILPTKHA